jgi:hypothetical protein
LTKGAGERVEAAQGEKELGEARSRCCFIEEAK